MNRNVSRLLLSIVVVLATAPFAYPTHVIFQITQNGTDDGDPTINNDIGYEINDEGFMVWQGWDGSDWEIFLTNSTAVNPPPFTSNTVSDKNPDINDAGTVVWERRIGNDDEIILEAGAGEVNISNNPAYDDTKARIGDGGHVTWQGFYYDPGPPIVSDYEIFLHNGTTASNISNDTLYEDTVPRVNSSGHVVWIKDLAATPAGKKEIFFYKGTTPTNLSNTYDKEDVDPQINDSDFVVWAGYDGSDYEIFFWDGQFPVASHVTQLTNNTQNDGLPQISGAGKVVWHGSDGTDTEIFFWDGQFPVASHVTQVTSNSVTDQDARINEAGEVTWRRVVGSYWQVFLWDGQLPPSAHTTQITTDTNQFKDPPKINDSATHLENDILWKGKGTYIDDMEIFAAISCTDLDQDGYCSEDTGGNDCVDDPEDDLPVCATCSCGVPACAPCARCIHPGTSEVCDGIDNNCEAGIDEDPAASASCDDDLFCTGVEYCQSGSCQDGPDECPDDGLFCNGSESCDETGDRCLHAGSPCMDANNCTDDLCNESEDSCSYPCSAENNQDPCCQDPVCATEPVCEETCVDNDDDGFGNPASPACTYPYPDCNDGNPSINPLATEIPNNGVDENCDGQDCFIATAAFGTALEGKIDVLRSFRDEYLMEHAAGRALVAAYYRYSPPIANAIADREWLRTCVRILLLPLVGLGSMVS